MNIWKQVSCIINSDLDKERKIRKIIDIIMNIPYKRIWSLNPTDMLSKWCGSCTPKHIFLSQCLTKLDVPVKFLVIPFYYKKIDLNIPNKYHDLVYSTPISYHIALKAKLKNDWIILDVTWDLKLKGFPINDKWDWKSDMEIWVTPEVIIERKSDPRTFEKRIWLKYTKKELVIRKEFYSFFDEFLVESRI